MPLRRRHGDRRRCSRNTTSHWWDGSEVYGADAERAAQLRDGAEAAADRPTATCPTTSAGFELTGFNESWWLGLSSLHTLFAREHNVLCDELRAHYRAGATSASTRPRG